MLKNRLGIKLPKEKDDAEARALERAMVGLVGKYNERHQFTAADIRASHKGWLGEIYEWAGEYRRVNVSKGDFPFAAADRVPFLMQEFVKTYENIRGQFSPCSIPGKQKTGGAKFCSETL